MPFGLWTVTRHQFAKIAPLVCIFFFSPEWSNLNTRVALMKFCSQCRCVLHSDLTLEFYLLCQNLL